LSQALKPNITAKQLLNIKKEKKHCRNADHTQKRTYINTKDLTIQFNIA